MLNVFLGDVEISTAMQVVVLVVAAIAMLMIYQSLTGRKLQVKAAVVDDRLESVQASELMRGLGAPEFPHEEGSMIPSKGLIIGNSAEPNIFENEFCKGKFLSLHRPTYDKSLNKSNKYPYGSFFKGKKRIWEARFQFEFKVIPKTSELFFGIELEKYVPMNKPTKKAMKLIISLLKTVVGDQIYHTPGDDPSVASGEIETPAFVMPLMAFDQYIVTPAGKEPPQLSDPNIGSMGSVRSKRVKKYQKEIEGLVFELGATYTFCFWGISQWLDKLNWEVKLPLANLDFNLFCGQPPVHVVVYTLKENGGKEQKHLRRRKNYYFHLAFWSSQSRPGLGRIKALLGDYAEKWSKQSFGSFLQGEASPSHRGTNGSAQPRSMFFCCMSR